jgi:predicted acyl esterase
MFGLNHILDGSGGVDNDDSVTRELIVQEHSKNWKAVESLQELYYIDEPLHWLSNRSVEEIDIERMIQVSNRKDVGLYTFSAWYDGSFLTSTVNRFNIYKTSRKKLTIGPWNHGGQQNASPFSDTRRPCFVFWRELIRFFDVHLKKDVADPHFYEEPPVRYFLLGAEK